MTRQGGADATTGVSQGASGLWCFACALGIGAVVLGVAVVLKRRFGLEDAISSNDGEGGE